MHISHDFLLKELVMYTKNNSMKGIKAACIRISAEI